MFFHLDAFPNTFVQHYNNYHQPPITARYNLARSKGRGGLEGGRARAVGFPAGAPPLPSDAIGLPNCHIVGLSLIEEFSALIRARITFLSSN